MYAKKSRFRLWPFVMLLLLILGAGIGSIAAKYVYSQKLEARVTFTAKLADNLLLQEHEAVRQPDGSYILNDTLLPKDGKTGNTYDLLPGLDIPKDPYVQVVNKTPIRSYLYIEVVDKTNSSIEYQIDTTKWSELTDVAGKDGGTVYVYYQLVKDKPNYVLTHANCENTEIPILTKPDGSEHEIKVSQHLLEENTSEDDVLTFYAYLFETFKEGEVEKTPSDIFTYHTTTP